MTQTGNVNNAGPLWHIPHGPSTGHTEGVTHTHTGAAAHTRLVQSVKKTFEDVFGHHKFDSSECSEAHKRLVSGE